MLVFHGTPFDLHLAEPLTIFWGPDMEPSSVRSCLSDGYITLAKRQSSPRRSERDIVWASPAVYYLGGLWPLGKHYQCYCTWSAQSQRKMYFKTKCIGQELSLAHSSGVCSSKSGRSDYPQKLPPSWDGPGKALIWMLLTSNDVESGKTLFCFQFSGGDRCRVQNPSAGDFHLFLSL